MILIGQVFKIKERNIEGSGDSTPPTLTEGDADSVEPSLKLNRFISKEFYF